jgi:hypothetical protein
MGTEAWSWREKAIKLRVGELAAEFQQSGDRSFFHIPCVPMRATQPDIAGMAETA